MLPDEQLTTAMMMVGTMHGTAPVQYCFHHSDILATRIPDIRAAIAAQPPVPHTQFVHVRLGTDPLQLAAVARAAADGADGAAEPCLQLTIDLSTQNAYYGSTRRGLPLQLAANRWLSLRTLAGKLQNATAPPQSACGASSVYTFVDVELGGLTQGGAFVVPAVREPGLRVGRSATVQGIVRRPELNGNIVTVLRSSGLGGSHDGWLAIGESPTATVDRWAVVLPDGEMVLLRPANLVAE
jgi:hypothetical protein